MDDQEFLTSENNSRYCLFPIKHHEIWKAYKNHFNCMWSAEEIDFSIDKKEWESYQKIQSISWRIS